MTRAPRVLALANVLAQPPSGVSRHAREVLPRAARRLAETGGELVLLTSRNAPLPFPCEPATVLSANLPSGPPLRRWWREGPALGRALRDRAQTGEPIEVVHTAHLPIPRGSLGGRTAALCWMVHDLRRADTWLGRRLIRRAARRAARIVTVSRFVLRELADLEADTVSRSTAIHHGADHFTPLPRDPSPGYLLHLGHLEPRKNVDLVLRALALDPELPPLRCCGAAKPGEEDRLRRLAAELRVTDRVRFEGAYAEPELPALLAGCAVTVVPSHLEGFGLTAAEALHAGVPLAIARAGALPEVAGPFGVSFAVDSPAECAHALRTAIARPTTELERGVRHAARYRWDRAAERLVDAWWAAREASAGSTNP